MSSITTCLSPQMLPLYSLSDKIVVVVDILRATSSMITAFAYDIASITPVPTLADCRMLKSEGFITAGERGGQKVEGFDRGNSPFDFMDHDLQGKKLAFTTTNGSQAIMLASEAKTVILGSFLNLSATAQYIIKRKSPVLILCAGWKGKFNIEDTLYAGALADAMQKTYEFADDSTLAASTLYQSVSHDIQGYLKRSSHAQRLEGLHNQRDLEFCLTVDKYKLNSILQRDTLIKVDSGS